MYRHEPTSEGELLTRAGELCGQTVGAIAATLHVTMPSNQTKNKGFVGDLIESFLGANEARNLPIPDFARLGIELKTIPVSKGMPTESTHVCNAALKNLTGEYWRNSRVFHKLKKILWVPIQADKHVKLPDRTVGSAFLWSPSPREEEILRNDWEEHMELIALGRFSELHAERGEYLQIRPKARNSRVKGSATSESGEVHPTLPRGFYLRTSFTALILQHSDISF